MSLSIDQINELQAENKRLREALRQLRHYTSYGSAGRQILEAALDPRREE